MLVVSRDPPDRLPQDRETVRFAIGLFLVAEIMFFAALVAIYIVLRFSADAWKPDNFPAVALGLPLSNLVILTASGVSLFLGSRALDREDPGGLTAYVAITFVCGLAFVAVQLVEFRRLMAEELALEGSVFGNVFYFMAGLHALHVAGGVLFLAYVLVQSLRGRYHQYRRAAVDLACYYWWLVVIVWLFFFSILYLF